VSGIKTTRADTRPPSSAPADRQQAEIERSPSLTPSSSTPPSPSGTLRSVAAALALGLALLVAYVALFSTAFRDPQPKGLEVAVFAPGGVGQQVEQGLERSAPGVYEPDQVGSAQAAREAVLDRTADGGLVVTPDGASVLTAEAGGAAGAQALAEGLTRAATETGMHAEVQDLRPLPDNDSRGMTGFFTMVGVLIGSLAGAIALWLFAPGLGLVGRIGALGLFAALGGLLAAVTTGGIVDTLDGAFWPVAGVTALLSLAVSLTTAGLLRLLGGAGIGVSMVLMVLLGLSSSGGLLSSQFLPGFFEAVGPLLPPAAGRDALRAVVYFDGHGSATALTVLVAWSLIGAAALLTAAGMSRQARPALTLSPQRPVAP
jgi:hypothetical protein